MDKTLRGIAIYLAWTLATTPCFPKQILAPILNSGSGAAISACGSSLSGVLADYWAGNLASSPVSTWNDSSSHGNSLTGNASPSWANNTFGTGLAGVTLNGSTQYFSTSALIPTSSYNVLSVYAVIKVASTVGGSYLTSNHNQAGGPTNTALSFGVNSSAKLSLDRQQVSNICTSTATLSTGTTYEVAFTYDGSTCNLYINGSLDSTAGSSPVIQTGIDRIGTNYSAGSVNAPFNGSIYEFVASSSPTYQSAAHTCWAARGLP